MDAQDKVSGSLPAGGPPGSAPFGPTGLWLIGARGSVATTAALGLAALAAGLTDATGTVTGQKDFDDVPLPRYTDLVIGGHDVSAVGMVKRAELLVESGMIPARLLDPLRSALEQADSRVRRGYLGTEGSESQSHAAARMARDITDFQRDAGLERVVVIDVASSEPMPGPAPEFEDPDLFEAALQEPGRRLLPPSSVGAYAAVLAGTPYICFTPSTALRIPALQQLAVKRGIPTAGQDGKTGQTWLRSVLAPAFSARGLRISSWAGTNLLGGGDGATLADPDAVKGKLKSKNRGLRELTGGAVTPLHIDNVPDLGETKVAWDHVSARGFLDTRITLQTTWSAYDSLLAAPMILDLARLMALADAADWTGDVPALGLFFKDPWGSDEHSFAAQHRYLLEWAHDAGETLGLLATASSTGA